MTREHHIAVWTARVAPDCDDPVESRLWTILDDVERDRARKFRFPRSRRIFVAAHGLKRLMLSELCDVPTARVFVSTSGNDKPRTVGMKGASFNISHCDGLVACAASLTLDPGIDCEPFRSPVQPEFLTDYLAPEERLWLADQPPSAQARAVVCLWTLKEAFIKASGWGLARPLASVAFTLSPPRVVFHSPAWGDAADWHFDLAVIAEDHVLALAWQSGHPDTVVTYTQVQLDALLAVARC